MNTKKAIQHLQENGFTVGISYVRTRLNNKNDIFFKPSNIVGKFLPGGWVNCKISKMFKEHSQLTDVTRPKIVVGRAKCMKIDLYIPRIGRAIAFERAVKNFPEARECLEKANLYSEYQERIEEEIEEEEIIND